jgi:peptidyl-prolyl cis-trans isomerase D
MAHLICMMLLSFAPDTSRWQSIGLVLLQILLILAIFAGVAAGVTIWVLYIRTLRRALERCSPASQAISPNAVWLLLIPIFNSFWHFLVVSRLATSLGNEFRNRNLPGASQKPGKHLGMAMCVLPFVNAAFNVVAAFFPRTVRDVDFLLGIYLALTIASLICWIAYWVKIAGYSKAIAEPREPAGVASPSPQLKPDFPYLLIGIICLSVFLLLPLLAASVSMVIFLTPGITGASSDTYAVIYPHSYSRFLGWGVTVSQERVRLITRRMVQQRNPQYADNPMILRYFEQQVGLQLVQQKVLLIEARKQGIRATDADVKQFLHQGAFDEVLYPNGQFIGPDRYAAFVGSQFNMRVEEFEQEIKNEIVIQRLRSLITAGVTVSDQDVRAAYLKENIKIKFDYAVLSADDLRKTINPSNGDLEAFFKKNAARYASAVPEQRKIAYFAFTGEQIPAGLTQPSQQEIQQYYTVHQSEYSVPEQARSRHILIKVPPGADAKTDAAAKRMAEALLKQILAGANFADLARKFSDDPGSKNQGGELGFFRRGATVPEFDNAIFTQKIGETTIVKSPFGYHIIQVEERQQAHSQPLSEVQPVIKATLIRQKAAVAEESYARTLTAEAVKNGLEKTAAAHHLKVATTPLIGVRDVISALPDSSEILGKAFQSRQGDPPQFAPTGEGYTIFQVTQVAPAHAPAFADWKNHVADDYRSEQLPALLSQKTQELAEKAKNLNDLGKAAKGMGVTLKSSDLVSATSQVPDFGQVGQVAPQLFNLKPGELSGPISVGRTSIVVKLVDKQEPTPDEIAKNFSTLRDQILDQHRAEVFNVFLSSIMEDYKKHNRIRMLSAEGEGTAVK